jgi:hypothetical protein
MIGYHTISAIYDAYKKGLLDQHQNELLNAMINSAYKDHFGLESCKNNGFHKSSDEAESVEIYSSVNGIHFNVVNRLKGDADTDEYGAMTKQYLSKIMSHTSSIKVLAKNRGVYPEWHLGNSGTSWIFLDALSIE